MTLLFVAPTKTQDIWRASFPSEHRELHKNQESAISYTAAPHWKYASKMIFNGRFIGTPMSVGPRLSCNQAVCSRRRLVARRLTVLIARYLALCMFYDPAIYHFMFGQGSSSWTQDDFAPPKQVFLRRLVGFSDIPITTREIIIRMHFVLGRVLPDYLVLSSYHDILAIIAVSTNLNLPQEWPPLFGSIAQAFTVRKYWARFWHLLIYRSFNHAAASLSKLLGIRMPQARYLNNAMVFVLSGLMHALVDWKMTETSGCGCWGMAVWFWLQIFGIMIEEAVQKTWVLIEKQFLTSRQILRLSSLKRTVGYLWVLCWLFWSVPKGLYSQIYCGLEAAKRAG